jgi:glutamine---fructose-6-phosphate transaminase (isomerizing)
MTIHQELMPLHETRKEVDHQPTVVAASLEANHSDIFDLAQEIVKSGIDKCYLVGSGDSMFAGLCVKEAFQSYAKMPLDVIQAYEYAAFGQEGVDEHAAIIVISSSGRVSTTRKALDRALKSSGLVIGVTDRAADDNPFYAEPKYKLVPGAIKDGWPTQTTTATIALLIDLAIQIGKSKGVSSNSTSDKSFDELNCVLQQMSIVLDRSSEPMVKVAQKVIDAKTICFVGSGPGYGVANIGAALMAEGPQRVGLPLYVEEFHHSLRINTMDLGMPLFLIAPRDQAYQRYLDTARVVKNWGGYLIAIVTEGDEQIASMANTVVQIPDVPVPMHSLLTMLPLHQFSIALTEGRVARGYKRPWYQV